MKPIAVIADQPQQGDTARARTEIESKTWVHERTALQNMDTQQTLNSWVWDENSNQLQADFAPQHDRLPVGAVQGIASCNTSRRRGMDDTFTAPNGPKKTAPSDKTPSKHLQLPRTTATGTATTPLTKEKLERRASLQVPTVGLSQPHNKIGEAKQQAKQQKRRADEVRVVLGAFAAHCHIEEHEPLALNGGRTNEHWGRRARQRCGGS